MGKSDKKEIINFEHFMDEAKKIISASNPKILDATNESA